MLSFRNGAGMEPPRWLPWHSSFSLSDVSRKVNRENSSVGTVQDITI